MSSMYLQKFRKKNIKIYREREQERERESDKAKKKMGKIVNSKKRKKKKNVYSCKFAGTLKSRKN